MHNTLTSTIQAGILGESTVSADGDVRVEASIRPPSTHWPSAWPAGMPQWGGAVIVSTVENTTLAHISGTSESQRAAVTDADILTVSASSNYRVSGLSLGATLGLAVMGGSVVANSIGGSTSAYTSATTPTSAERSATSPSARSPSSTCPPTPTA